VLAIALSFVGCSSLEDGSNKKLTKIDGVHLKLPDQSEIVYTETSSLSTLAAPSVVTPTAKQLLTKDGWIKHTFSDGRVLKFRNYLGQAMIDDDVILVPTQTVPEMVEFIESKLATLKKIKSEITLRSVGLNYYGCSLQIIWCWNPTSNYFLPSKTMYYTLDSNFGAIEKQMLRDSIVRWNATSVNIKFYEYFGQQGAVIPFIRYVTNDFCGRTMIGYQARVVTNIILPDHIDINPNCLSNDPINSTYYYNGKTYYYSDATVHHEMGHKVGMPHEQERCDRNDFVIMINYSGTQNRLCGSDYRYYTLFDFDSIMLYSRSYVTPKSNLNPTTYRGNPGFYLGWGLSSGDIQTINGMYP
jgi:Astacin (Peptidase family M12A)